MNINGHMGGKTEEKSHGEDVTTLKDNPTNLAQTVWGSTIKKNQTKPQKIHHTLYKVKTKSPRL